MSNRAIIRLAAVVGVLVMLWMLINYEAPELRRPGRTVLSPESRIEVVTLALKEDPLNPREWRALGIALVEHDDPETRTQRWIAAAPGAMAAAVPVEAYAWYWCGWAWSNDGEDTLAAQCWRRALDGFDARIQSLLPEEVRFETWFRKGISHERLGENDAYLACFNTAAECIERERGHASLQQRARWCRMLLGRYAESGHRARQLDAYALWLNVVSEDTAAATLIDWAERVGELTTLARNHDLHPAIEALLPRLNPLVTSPEGIASLAALHLALGQEQSAADEWGRAADALQLLVTVGSPPSRWYELSRYRCRAGQHDQAMDAWRIAVNEGLETPAAPLDDKDFAPIHSRVRQALRAQAALEPEPAPATGDAF
ncbi:MAG: hypothetical protein KDA21_08675 [Phycisphaerales bacterium]|nr:hypothetical protein [Phycisphaerales bacterium]